MNNIETDTDIAQKLFKSRMVAKTISQLSFELREIDKALPADYYEFTNAEGMLRIYEQVENEVLRLAQDITKNREKE